MTRKTSGIKRGAAASSKVALVAGMLVAPVLSTPTTALAQPTTQQQSRTANTAAPKRVDFVIKFSSAYLKVKGKYDIVGIENHHTIYKDARGKYFYLDGVTGDMKFLETVHLYLKMDADRTKLKGTTNSVTILGMDAAGNVVQVNSAGEKFYLDSNGDMTFVK